jgi:hypothetical protein
MLFLGKILISWNILSPIAVPAASLRLESLIRRLFVTVQLLWRILEAEQRQHQTSEYLTRPNI